MLNLTDYQETELLYTGTRTLVYRATRLSDDQPVIIKVLRNPHPSFNELVQFRNQYIITCNLEKTQIVQPLALKRYGNGYALVMPDEGAISLDTYWRDSEQNLGELLKIAIQLAEALHILAGQQIIHKDIKPANILIHPQSKQIQLIDFSIASLLPKEQRQLVNPKGLEGTLSYISPEQTGRMNRGIDYRTDFYSLGVTLYELLTGMLPFSLSDPLELVHCHIAQLPIAPVDLLDAQGQPYPAPLSAIIMKLMAKNAEDRYQSALGLKHDLEQCLRSLEKTGEIANFELGERDVCDRFLIPEKLYGREAEVQTLLDAFDRVANGNSEMLLVAGFSGIGKTAVVNEVHKPIVRQKGYFIKGKFDQFNRNIPFSAFVQAFRELMGQLLSESDEDLANWKAKILDAVGENGQVLIEVIPELERIIDKQNPAPELSGTAAQNRFNLLFQKFITVFTTPEHPLTIFVDDLQWADSASLNLMKVLMGKSESGYLLLLGAYRDNEVFPAHPLMLTLADLEKQNAEISTITLEPLSENHINQLVAETLSCPVAVAQPLTELVYRKTQGNPFFTTQFLKGLYGDELITFERDLGYWQCDLVQVQDAALTDDVVVFMVGRLHKFPEETQNVLKLAACIGDRFDLETLAIICEMPSEEVAAKLWGALREGWVLPQSEAYKFFQGKEQDEEKIEGITVKYRFLHDRVQQAAYHLITEEDRKITHLTIGRLLLNNTPNLEANIFAIVNHWNIAIELLADDGEKMQLARLNRLAGCKASDSAAYDSALQYFQIGLSAIEENCWQTEYDLALQLHEGAAKSAFVCGDYAQMERWSKIVLQQGKTILDKVKTYDVQIQSRQARSQPALAIEIALTALELLDITLPDAPTPEDTQNELQKTKALWRDRDISELLNLPTAIDAEKIATVTILSSLFAPSFFCKPEILPFIACRQVQLSILHGNCEHSAFGYANYSAILNTLSGDPDSSYQFGQLAIHLVEKLNAKEIKARTFNQAAAFSMHGQVAVRESLPILQAACQGGLEQGDLEFAGYSAYVWSQYSYFSGLNLTDLLPRVKNYCLLLSRIKQEMSLNCTKLVYQATLNLLGESLGTPTTLKGLAFDEKVALEDCMNNKDFTGIQYIFLHKVVLCCLFFDLDTILEYVDESERYLSAVTGMLMMPESRFFGTLARLLAYDLQSSERQEQLLLQIDRGLAEIKKWAKHSPQNFQHKLNLLSAERDRVLGKIHAAADYYDRAIAGAKENKYIQEEALANELAAKFYLDWGKVKIAAVYMQEAYYCYAHWGAKAKIEHLEANHPELLTPILQKQRVEFNAIDSLDTLTKTLTATLQSQTQSSTNISEALDFAAILQAAQKLSSTINLKQLLGDITHIILTNAGAQKMALLVPSGQQWQLQATAEQVGEGNVNTQTSAQPLTAESLPVRLIQYVKNAQEPVLISEAKTEITGILEGYLLKHQPQSVFCVPLINQGKLVAIAYLEHPTTKGVFTRNRQTIIEFLCAQAAVALQNAQLYSQAQQSQAKAEQALIELQQAQIQLVQSEKMSALGNLVAGVAHEINNPVGFLKGNIQPAQDYVQDLLGLIDLYQEKMPDPDADIEDEIESIDLEFVREDLPKLIGSMNAGVDRIRNISDSLRTFSRKDQDHKTAFNIHDGIESTLLILKHRTKANEQRPKVEVLKNYGELPEVQCLPGQLNQVFMNILANAVDAFDEFNQGKTYQEIESNPNTITIQTSVIDEQVQIKIQDNGCGMKPETVERIFEQGFTTKGVGKGTGLGMAIAQQIITEKHGGAIACTSELGQGTTFMITLPIRDISFYKET
ncbi:MAG: AAA family ATPase [Spirulina sp. SIO3F2]|nr:AAA family ATPase [Spirulina sp. SIO3F2]